MNDIIGAIALTISSGVFTSLWEGALILTAAWAALRVLPSLDAATRYAVWLIALAMMIAAPVVTLAMTAQPAAPAAVISAQPSLIGPAQNAVAAKRAAEAPRAQAASESRAPHARIDVPLALSIAVASLWALLAALRLVALIADAGRLRRLIRDATPQGRRFDRDILASRDARIPLAIGFVRPAVLLPARLMDEASPEALDAVIMHEVAHLCRRDVWTNAFARLLEAFLILNPAAWIVARQLAAQREIACDDWVVGRLGTGDVFARTLAELASCSAFAPIAAPSAIGPKHVLVTRIERLLDRHPRTLRLSPRIVAAACALAVLFTVLAPSVSPVLALASPPQGTSACSDHGILAQPLDLATGKPTDRWVPLPDDPSRANDPRATVLDVTVDASGHLTSVHALRSPTSRDARGAEHFFKKMVVAYRPAVVNCKPVSTTQRVAIAISIEGAPVLSNVSAVYPNGWSAQHPGACRIPDLIHGGVPDVHLVTRVAVTASAMVSVDGQGHATSVTLRQSSGTSAYDGAVIAAAKAAVYPLDDRSGFKPVRPNGTTLAWNATHGYDVYSKCAPLPTQYLWTTTFPPAE